jgi:hypothetical protein
MAAVTPIRSVSDLYSSMEEVELGKIASGGYGVSKRKQFISDVRELCRLAKMAEKALSEGRIR